MGEANVRAIQGYQSRPIAAHTQFFVPAAKGGLAQIAGRDMAEDGDHGWGAFLGRDVELHTVPGDHFTMMLGDGGNQIARKLSLLLNEAITLPK